MKPTKQEPIKAKHAYRKDNEGNPLVRLFNLNVFRKLATSQFEGKEYPHQGWVITEQYGQAELPPEATPEQDEDTGSSSEEIEALAESILEGNDHTIKEIQSVIKGLELDVNLTQPKSELVVNVTTALQERKNG